MARESEKDRMVWLGRLSAAVLVLGLLYAALLIPGVRPGPEYNPWIDAWLNGLFRVGVTAVLVVRSQVHPRERAAWLFLGGGMAASLAGSIAYFAHYRYLERLPAASVADLGWLAFYPLMYVGMVLLLRARVRRLLRSLWLDGIVAGLTTATVAATIVGGSDGPFAGTSSTGLTIVYPIADLILFAIAVAAIVILGRSTDRVWWLLCGSFIAYAATDAIYAAEVARDTYTPGLLDLGWLIARLGLVAAAWTSARPAARARPTPRGHMVLTTPGLSLIVVLGVLFYGTQTRIPMVAAALGLAAGTAIVARTLLTFGELRDLAEARRQARTDDLTGLPNRRALTEALDRALRHRSQTRPLALLVLDLDSFKGINDTLGHHRGDELLTLLAPRLQIVSRPRDLVARIGGDEFGVLLDGADSETAEAVAERIGLACRRPFDITGRTFTVSASVGIAVFPQDGDDSASLLQHADIAMYAAKGTHAGHSFYRPEYHRASQAHLEAIEELRTAISARQFLLHYQPKVSLADMTIVGVEALVRWLHPDRGLLGPHEFLPQLEGAGLMPELTAALLDQAMAQWREWEREGTPTTVAVNLSVSDLLDPSLPEEVTRTLARHGAPGSALVLELTEDLLLADPTRGHAVVEDLAARGVRVQIDDYGTGFSTLGYLRDLPALHGLKLDRSFVTHVARDRRVEAIVASTIALAADLGLELVAEGVETEVTRDRLVELDCPQAQGYLFGRPVPAAEVPFDRVDAQNVP